MRLYGLDIMTGLFILILFGGIISVIYMYIVDKRQTKQAIRHNYPVIGRFRYLFEKQGEFFRQYFFAQDREEMPFNRAERSWVYRAAKNVGDILDMVEHIRQVTGKPVGFKFVLGHSQWLDDLLTEINKRGVRSAPDFMTLDSADGGTGAAPQPLMDYVGLTLKESLPLLTNILEKYNLRKQIKVIASGKLITPSIMAWA